MSVIHPIEPIYDEKSHILILGSFPSVKSRELGFYYGHPQNRFWKVLDSIMSTSSPSHTYLADKSIEEKKKFLLDNHIAVWDVIHSCTITGSSDSSIEDVTPNDISSILNISDISVIYINGKKAYELYMRYIFPELKIKYGKIANAVCLPSTSPANAACSLEKLIKAWGRIQIGLHKTKTNNPYYSLNDFASDYYDKKLYKLSLDGGFTCPNRDGTVSTGGCIFCDGEGSGAFSGTVGGLARNISEQLAYQKALIKDKLPKNKELGYIAYFQAYTGTYGNVSDLKRLYMEAVSDPEVDILSIATRPDCLGSEVISLLQEINQIKPVWIELGLQTIHKKTAQKINRGYDLKVYDNAVKSLAKIGIAQIITHVIIGLPGETGRQIVDTVKYVADSPSNGIKLQLLHVIKGTKLEEEFNSGLFSVLEMDEYIDILKECIDELPPDMVVHRLTGDGAKKNLCAPLWSADKKKVLNSINRALW